MADIGTSTAPGASAVSPDQSYKWKAFTPVALALVTNVMSFSIIFLALSSIADDFGVTLRQVSWVILAQSLTVSAALLPLGKVADMTGRKRFHLAGIALFAAGAVMASLSPNLSALIGARVVMAIGSAMVQSVSSAIVASVFPPEERGKGLGSTGTAVAVGGALGPTIGGLALQVSSWQVLFLLMAIPAVIAFIASYLILDDRFISSSRRIDRGQFDWAGAALSAAGMAALIVAISNPFNLSYSSPLAVFYTAAAVVLLAAFVMWELRVKSPMLELRMFRNALFRNSTLSRVLGFMGASSTRFMTPVFLLSLLHESPAVTGIIMFTAALGMGLSAQLGGRLSDRFGYRPFGVIGFSILIGTSIWLGLFTLDVQPWLFAPLLFINGIGMGIWSSPNVSATLGSVPRSSYGIVGALVELSRNLGNVTGQAIVAAIIAGTMAAQGFDIPLSEVESTPGAPAAFLDGWRIAYFIVAGLSAAALVATILTPRKQPPLPTAES